jgi:hypothetical protein
MQRLGQFLVLLLGIVEINGNIFVQVVSLVQVNERLPSNLLSSSVLNSDISLLASRTIESIWAFNLLYLSVRTRACIPWYKLKAG